MWQEALRKGETGHAVGPAGDARREGERTTSNLWNRSEHDTDMIVARVLSCLGTFCVAGMRA